MTKRKKILIFTVISIPVFLILLYLYAMSSFAICRHWLPLVSKITGMNIAASEVKISLFSKKDNISVQNLTFSDRSKLNLTIKEMNASLDILKLISNKYEVGNLDFNGVDITFYHSPAAASEEAAEDDMAKAEKKSESSREKKSFDPKSVKIGPLSVMNLAFRYVDKNSPDNVLSIALDSFHLDGIEPGQNMKLNLKSRIQLNHPIVMSEAVDAPEATGNVPKDFSLDIHDALLDFSGEYSLAENLIPSDLKISMLLHSVTGTSGELDLASFSIASDLKTGLRSGKIEIENFTITESWLGGQTFRADVTGSVDPVNFDGNVKIVMEANNPNPYLIPFLTNRDIIPHELKMKFNADVAKNGSDITYQGAIHADASSVQAKNFLFEELAWASEHKMAYRLSDKKLKLQKLFVDFSDKSGAGIKIGNQGDIILSFNELDKPSFISGDGRLNVDISNLNLSIFDSFAGNMVFGGLASLKAELSPASAKNEIRGEIDLNLTKFSIKGLVVENDIAGKLELSVNPAKKSLELHPVVLQCLAIGKRAVDIKMDKGLYDFNSGRAELHGAIHAKPAVIMDVLTLPRQDVLEPYLGDMDDVSLAFMASYDAKEHDGNLAAVLRFPSLRFIEEQYAATELEVTVRTETSKEKAVLSSLRVYAKDLLELEVSADAPLPFKRAGIDLELLRFDEDFLTSLLEYAQLPKTVSEIPDNLSLDDIKLSLHADYDQDKVGISVGKVLLSATMDNKAPLTVEVEPFHMRLSPFKLETVSLSAETRNLDLMCVNSFLVNKEAFQMRSGLLSGKLKAKVGNIWETIQVKGMLSATELNFQTGNKEWPVGVCSLDGEVLLAEYCKRIGIDKLIFNSDDKKTDLSAKGTMEFMPVFSAGIELKIDAFDETLPGRLFPALTKDGRVKSFQVRGSGTWKNDPASHSNRIHGDFTVTDFRSDLFAEQNFAQSLNGDIHLDFLHSPDGITLNQNRINIADNAKKFLFNLSLDGGLGYKEKAQPDSLAVSSDGIDIAAILALFGIPDKEGAEEGQGQGKEVPAAAPVPQGIPEHEIVAVAAGNNPRPAPAAFDLNGLRSELRFDIKNVTYTDNISMDLTGLLNLRENTITSKDLVLALNKFPINLGIFLNHGQAGGFPYEFTANSKKIDLAPLIKAFADMKALQEMTADLEFMDFIAKGKGFTRDDFAQNLTGGLKMEFGNFAIPFSVKDASILLEIMFLPIEYIPKLVDLIPNDTVKSGLNYVLGGAIDIISGKKALSFNKGEIALGMEQGNITFEQFEFNGTFVKGEIVRGVLNPFENTLRLNIVTNFGSVAFPLTVTGNINSPSPDLIQFPIDFMKENAFNIISGAISIFSSSDDKGKNDNTAAETEPDPAKEAKEKLIKTGLNFLQKTFEERQKDKD